MLLVQLPSPRRPRPSLRRRSRQTRAPSVAPDANAVASPLPAALPPRRRATLGPPRVVWRGSLGLGPFPSLVRLLSPSSAAAAAFLFFHAPRSPDRHLHATRPLRRRGRRSTRPRASSALDFRYGGGRPILPYWSVRSVSDHGDAEGVTASMEGLRVEREVSSSIDTSIDRQGNSDVVAAADDDDIWGDATDSPDRESTLDREWSHRKNKFYKMGYRDGITEGQKDSAQEGFNVGFRQSVTVGYKCGLVRGVTSALASLPDSLKEKLLPVVHCRGKLLDLHNSVQAISADAALQMFHDSIRQNNNLSGEPLVTSGEDGATDSNRLKTLSKNLALLLNECPDVKVRQIWHE